MKRAACGAVDHPVVVGERQRQHQARRELVAAPHRPQPRARDAEDRDLGRVDDRREGGAADAAQARDREAAALEVVELELLVARPRAHLRRAPRASSKMPFWSTSRTTGTTSPSGVSTAIPMWKYFLRISALARRRQRRVDLGMGAQRRHAGLHDERQRRELEALLLGLRGVLLAKRLELGDVGLVVLGDVRHVQPGAVDVLRGQPLDAPERPLLDLAELREVDRAASPGGRGRRRRRRRRRERT